MATREPPVELFYDPADLDPTGELQRLVRDVLIARSARRVNAAVVTYNASDFEKIRRFCSVRLVDPVGFL